MPHGRIMIPRIPGCAATTRPLDGPVDVVGDGTRAIPARRWGAWEHMSARNRLWARARRSQLRILDGAGHQAGPNGGDAFPVTASASANNTRQPRHRCRAPCPDGVVGALKTLLVLGLPAHDVVVVELERLRTVRRALIEEAVEIRVVPASRYFR